MFKQVCMGLALSLTISSAQAAPLTYFEDDFSGYGDTLLNAPDSKFLGNWTTTNGTVDYIGVNDPSFGNPQNNGLICEINTACVDLDGSTGDAGVFSTAHTFQDGYYHVLFAISGNNRSGSDIVTVTFGNIVQQISLAFDKVTFSGAVEFGGIFNNILVGPNSPTVLSFSNAGGDNIGMLLKYVRIERVAPVPVPAAGGMLLLGLMGMAALRRRKARA
jgi:hypothetical protein